MNNILIFILIILILHLYIKMNLLDNSYVNRDIIYEKNNNTISEETLEKIDDYDINAQNELLKYLDNEKKNNILDTTDLVNKSISSDTINNSFNNLNTDLYTFDDVPTHSNSTLEQDNIVDNINDVSGYYESDNQYYSLT